MKLMLQINVIGKIEKYFPKMFVFEIMNLLCQMKLKLFPFGNHPEVTLKKRIGRIWKRTIKIDKYKFLKKETVKYISNEK